MRKFGDNRPLSLLDRFEPRLSLSPPPSRSLTPPDWESSPSPPRALEPLALPPPDGFLPRSPPSIASRRVPPAVASSPGAPKPRATTGSSDSVRGRDSPPPDQPVPVFGRPATLRRSGSPEKKKPSSPRRRSFPHVKTTVELPCRPARADPATQPKPAAPVVEEPAAAAPRRATPAEQRRRSTRGRTAPEQAAQQQQQQEAPRRTSNPSASSPASKRARSPSLAPRQNQPKGSSRSRKERAASSHPGTDAAPPKRAKTATTSPAHRGCRSTRRRPITFTAALSVPPLPRIRFPAPKRPQGEESYTRQTIPVDDQDTTRGVLVEDDNKTSSSSRKSTAAKLYATLEAVADRVEMHRNIGEQRNNWNTLLLNSVNMITLTAATMTGVAATAGAPQGGSLLALKLSSTLLFSAAAGMLVIMNKIQPSQLAEEQRNAARLFEQLHNQIQTTLALNNYTEVDVKNAMEKVLALDAAYPLPLLGKMIEKFPEEFEPAVWWPKPNEPQVTKSKTHIWSEELAQEMSQVVRVLRTKDSEDYMRLGNLALKVNKILAISGPLLTGVAAAASAFVGDGSCAGTVAVMAGAMAGIVNTLEHGGQVGMVVEMYRNCAGFFTFMEESIESAAAAAEGREDGEMLEMKVALQLGRSPSQLRDLAHKSSSSLLDGTAVDEFASKLF
ncbi:hypothetical protein Tsubulata_029164 [Turnera subulata]|uniref:F-box protein n=1 Tax=Turnera subulata TaxID=218843 RepID=A0A9Q0JEJ7_9ROSI|nr:hypothetical protein Tsubulata_029164 [Turnera subulata]